MPSIQIKIGASLGRDVASVYKPLVAAARQARAQIERELNATGNAPARPRNVATSQEAAYNRALAALERLKAREASAAEKSAAREAALADKVAQAKVRAEQRAFDQKLRNSTKAREAENAAILRDVARHERMQERVAARRAREESGATESLARRTSYRAIRHFGSAINTAAGVAGGIARGAGVETNLGSLVGQAVSLESKATSITQSGYLEGEKGAAGTRQNPADVLRNIKEAANGAALSFDSVADGLQRFTSHTSDLATGREILGDLARLAKANNTDFDEMATAAGDVAKKLGDIPNKGQATLSVMRMLVKQGKLGAVEFIDMQKSIASMVGPSGQFAMGSTGAMAQLGAIFQIVKSTGYAKNPAQAATSVSSFAGDLTSKAGLKSLQKAGIKDSVIFADKGHTKLNSPEEIIIAALEKSNGDLGKLSAMFGNKRSGAVLKSFSDMYTGAGGGAAGANAVRATFKQYSAGASDDDVGGALSAALKTSASQVQLFNNKLAEIGEGVAARVLPQLERLAPAILKAVESLGQFAGWVAENPGKAIAAALTASIARAGIESVVRSGIDQLIKNAIAGGPNIMGGGATVGGVTMPGSKIGAVATLGAGLAIASAAITIESVGELIIDKIFKERGENQNAADAKDTENENALYAARTEIRMTGALSGPGRANLQRAFAMLGSEVDKKQLDGSTNEVDKMNLERQLAVLEGMRQILAGGITVKNMPGPGGPSVPGSGRTGPNPTRAHL